MRLLCTALFTIALVYPGITQTTLEEDINLLKAEIENGADRDSIAIKLRVLALKAIRSSENDKVIQQIEPLFKKYEEEAKSNLNEFGYLSYYIGLAHTNLGNYLSAIPPCEEAEFLAEIRHKEDTLLRMQRKIILSHLYSSTGQLKKARQINEEGLTLATALGNPIYEFRYLMNSGNTLQYMGEFNYAISYFKRALQVVNQSLGDPELLAAAYTNIGASYLSSHQPEEAIKALQKASALGADMPNKDKRAIYDRLSTIIRFSDLAKAYTQLNKLDSAFHYASKAVVSIREEFPEGHSYVGDFLLDLGIVLSRKGEFGEARKIIKQSIKVSDQFLGEVNITSAQAYANLADTYIEAKDFEIAHDLYGQALKALFKGDSLNMNNNLPSINANTISPTDVISILHKKAKAYDKEYVEDTSNKILLSQANETYTTVIHYIQKFKSELNDVESRALFSSAFKEIFGDAIATAHKLYETEGDERYIVQALNWMEKNKANELFISLNTAFLKEAIGDSLLDSESTLKSKITYLQNKKEVAEGKDEVINYSTELFNLENELDDVKTELSKKYRQYYIIKYGNKDLDIEQVKQLIKGNATLASYFVTKGEVYYINISADDASFGTIGLSSQMADLVNSFNNAIRNNLPTFFDISHKLYTFLEPSLKVDKNSLMVIVPDGDLNYLSFDALAVDNSIDKNQYLLQHVNTLYAPSVNYLALLNNNGTRTTGTRASVFAPDFLRSQDQLAVRTSESSFSLTALPNAINEAESIANLYGTKPMIGPLASETNFKTDVKKAGIVHMATHALIDSENPNNSRLFLESDSINDGSLYAFELYTMSLKADLVSLSACNTGIGQYKKGEGVMSLARAFMYAGASNVMMSLWSVPDRSTSQIMESFYQYMKDGKSKPNALRLAKLDYLANSDENTSNPFHWAGFVLVGEVESIQQDYNKYLIIGLFLTLALSVFFIRKRRKGA